MCTISGKKRFSFRVHFTRCYYRTRWYGWRLRYLQNEQCSVLRGLFVEWRNLLWILTCNTLRVTLCSLYLSAFQPNFNGRHITSQLRQDKPPTLDPATPLPSTVYIRLRAVSFQFIKLALVRRFSITRVSHELLSFLKLTAYIHVWHIRTAY